MILWKLLKKYLYFYQYSANCVHSSRCGTNLMSDAIGDVYACDHLLDGKYYLGFMSDEYPLLDMVKKSITMQFGQEKILRPECQLCDVKMVCQERCLAHLNPNNLNMLCKRHYLFCSEILKNLKNIQQISKG
ncbi:SPASM domain-containing protein [Neisseriaceae bacterium PsAf]|nr:SPASM domain-containing protein [Neisseriaceae bacterium PsAf]MCV2503854.1 SPASM domain-containing protein [Neisseriaceae bacterium]